MIQDYQAGDDHGVISAQAVIALDLDRPTADFTQGMAMETPDLVASIQTGKNAVDPQADVILLGEMGIGNSTVAAALAALTVLGAARVTVAGLLG